MENGEKRKLIKDMVRQHRPELICLQETKLQTMEVKTVKSLEARRNTNWCTKQANGVASGILMFWDNDLCLN